MVEITTRGPRHKVKVSWWDSHAKTLCGEKFEHRAFEAHWIIGDTNCRECREAHRAGKRL
ncbi:hypothetical protein [Saccharopolyspora griseoalba]|uniref:Zinc-ribbon domain-containing protein n=1 Tax=Saccharopolyspora griseoalba TaxID=1431848 RepID=A0ABW2LCV2_9PSEU